MISNIYKLVQTRACLQFCPDIFTGPLNVIALPVLMPELTCIFAFGQHTFKNWYFRIPNGISADSATELANDCHFRCALLHLASIACYLSKYLSLLAAMTLDSESTTLTSPRVVNKRSRMRLCVRTISVGLGSSESTAYHLKCSLLAMARKCWHLKAIDSGQKSERNEISPSSHFTCSSWYSSIWSTCQL